MDTSGGGKTVDVIKGAGLIPGIKLKDFSHYQMVETKRLGTLVLMLLMSITQKPTKVALALLSVELLSESTK